MYKPLMTPISYVYKTLRSKENRVSIAILLKRKLIMSLQKFIVHVLCKLISM